MPQTELRHHVRKRRKEFSVKMMTDQYIRAMLEVCEEVSDKSFSGISAGYVPSDYPCR